MIYYFTGTGNSLWAARKLAEQLGERAENLVHYKDKKLVCNDDVIGVVCPTYMANLPWFVKKVFLNAELNPNAYTFLVATSNNGKAQMSPGCMDSLLVRNGTSLMGYFDLRMPGNCMESSAKENEQRLAAAPQAVAEIGQKIMARTVNYKSSGKAAEDGVVEKSSFYAKKSDSKSPFMGGMGKQLLEKMKNYRSEGNDTERASSYGGGLAAMFQMPALTFDVTEACNGCGVCESICPMQNITIADGMAVHTDTCAACYACFHWCPKHATLPTAKMMRDRSQYHHPDVTIDDLKVN